MLEALTRAPTADWLGHRWGAADSAPDVADFGYKSTQVIRSLFSTKSPRCQGMQTAVIV